MKTRKYFLSKSQHGGMLVELMLSVAIAAILIPFIFRYQQNAVERARNISITKQMETVQSALERYIIKNRMVFLNVVGDGAQQFTVNMTDLAGYGLSDNFIEDHQLDYQLRVLKYGNNANKPVLQGVVLLSGTNNPMSTLRTHEIANLGGGKVGFIQGDKVYGGFNVFKGNKTSFGLGENDKTGVLGTTRTMRGNSLYLWRLGSDGTDGRDNATMLSLLNLDGHNIANVGNIWANKATFSDLLNVVNAVNTERLVFTGRPSVSGQYSTYDARVFGDISANSGTLNITNNLTVKDTANFNEFKVNSLMVNGNVSLADASIPEGRVGEKTFNIGESMDVNTIKDAGTIISNAEKIGALSPFLWVKHIIYPAINNGYDPDLKPDEDDQTGVFEDGKTEDGKTEEDKKNDDLVVAGQVKPKSPRSSTTSTSPDITSGTTTTNKTEGAEKQTDSQNPEEHKDPQNPEEHKDPQNPEEHKDPQNQTTPQQSVNFKINASQICGEGHSYCWNAEYKTSSGQITHMAIFNELILLNMNRLLYKYHCGCTGSGCTYGTYSPPPYNGDVRTHYPLVSEKSDFGKVFAGCTGPKKGINITVNEALEALKSMKSQVLAKYVQYYNDNRN